MDHTKQQMIVADFFWHLDLLGEKFVLAFAVDVGVRFVGEMSGGNRNRERREAPGE